MSELVATAPVDKTGVTNVGGRSAWDESANRAVNQIQFVSFAIGDDQYGVDIMAVREIRGWSEITRLPKQPDYVRGFLNLRGAIVPIVDLRCRFGQGLTETTPLNIVIVVDIDGCQVGLIGDRVLDIVSVNDAQIKVAPRIGVDREPVFIGGLVPHDGVMIALIDLPRLLTAGEKSRLDLNTNQTQA